ncbi:MAG: GNAT family N-acetyltransferase [Candidatus Sumerlaeia bacterium]
MPDAPARLQFRPARMFDWPEMARLWRVNFPNDKPGRISYHLRHYLGCIFVGCLDGRVAGFYTILPGDHPDSKVAADLAWLDFIALDPALQGRGLGRELIADAERQAAAWGYRRMEMACDRDNRQAIGINRNRGYELLDRPGSRLSWACHLTPTGPLRPPRGPLFWRRDRCLRKYVYLPIYLLLTGLRG